MLHVLKFIEDFSSKTLLTLDNDLTLKIFFLESFKTLFLFQIKKETKQKDWKARRISNSFYSQPGNGHERDIIVKMVYRSLVICWCPIIQRVSVV